MTDSPPQVPRTMVIYAEGLIIDPALHWDVLADIVAGGLPPEARVLDVAVDAETGDLRVRIESREFLPITLPSPRVEIKTVHLPACDMRVVRTNRVIRQRYIQ